MVILFESINALAVGAIGTSSVQLTLVMVCGILVGAVVKMWRETRIIPGVAVVV
jgi:hypothetical protein